MRFMLLDILPYDPFYLGFVCEDQINRQLYIYEVLPEFICVAIVNFF